MPAVSILIKPASSLCNMKCKYCFYADVASSREVRSYGMMSEDTLEALVRRVFEYAEYSATFSFQGGEPTLVGLDFYKRLIELEQRYNVKKIHVSNCIQTNGYAITSEWAEFFARHSFLVGLSIDGTKEIHDCMRLGKGGVGTYDSAIAAAELFQKHGVSFNVLCVVNQFVAKRPVKVYSQLSKFGYVQFIACLDGLDGQKADYSLTVEQYERFLVYTFDCYYDDFMSGKYVSVRNFDNYIGILLGRPPENCAMMGKCSCYFVVEGDGSVFPCDFYVLDEWKIGSVHTNSLKEMISSDKGRQFVEGSLKRSEECKRCKYYSLCRGGCRRECEPCNYESGLKNAYCKAYYGFFEKRLDKMKQMAYKIKSSSGR